jgi:hypothetical protein
MAKEVSWVPWLARWLRNGASGDPVIWSKEWFSSTTMMIRCGPATDGRLVSPGSRAAVVGGLVGVVPTGRWPSAQPAPRSTTIPTSSVQDLCRQRPTLPPGPCPAMAGIILVPLSAAWRSGRSPNRRSSERSSA